MEIIQGKIYSFIGGLAKVKIKNEYVTCKPLGIFRYKNKKIQPLVGDNVNLEFKDGTYQIVDILERQNELIRPSVANVDLVLIIQSIVEPNLSKILLDKFLMFYEFHIDNVAIAFSKTDLLNEIQLNEFKIIKQEFKDCGYNVYDLNNKYDFKEILNTFNRKYICLVGNSGVGKSTFLNKINPNLLLKVQEISKALNRGKHTTTNVAIIDFDNYHIIDTPGFSSLELNLTNAQLAVGWKQFRDLSIKCKFSNCLHLSEPNCEIKNQVKNGKILKFRYNNYCNFIENNKNNLK